MHYGTSGADFQRVSLRSRPNQDAAHANALRQVCSWLVLARFAEIGNLLWNGRLAPAAGILGRGDVGEKLEGRSLRLVPGDGEPGFALEVGKRLDEELTEISRDGYVAGGKAAGNQKGEEIADGSVDSFDGAEIGLWAEDFREKLLRVFWCALGMKTGVMAAKVGMRALAGQSAATACDIAKGATVS